jgi:hypothetical protein
MDQFQKHMDLNDAVDRRKEKEISQKTWLAFKTFFSKEIKKNRNRKGTFKEIGLASAVTQQQVETNQENQQILTAHSIEQNNVIKSLMAQVAALTTAVTTPPPQAQPKLMQQQQQPMLMPKMMPTIVAMMNMMTTGGSTGGTGKAGAVNKTGRG